MIDHNFFGFKNAYSIDIGESYMEYSKRENEYSKSMCYNNAFVCLGHIMSDNSRYVIGYVLSSDGTRKVAVRHAWNINKRGVALDVTMPANDENPLSLMHFVYLPVEEYTPKEALDAVEANNNLPCLPISNKEKRYLNKLRKKGFEILD